MKSRSLGNNYKNFFLFVIATIFGSVAFENPAVSTRVPDWAQKAIWYQIFPERFFNGDTTNDPRPSDLKGAWPYVVPKGWRITPWTADWYKLQPWEEKDGHGFYWNSGTRRYGGDLEGIIEKLDYQQDLGINAIYLNPIFESPTLHKYDASMYRHVDNNFGPNPELDKKIWKRESPTDENTWKWTTADSLFLKLLREAHKRGIRVIIDGVFNHVGTTFWAFRDVLEKQQESKFKNWFIIKSFDNPATKENEFDYAGWYGIKDLPEFREDENGLIAPVANHIHKIVKRWMDPNGDGDPSDGIDGWRLDVAEMVNHKFWKKFRKWVKEINPDAYISGEVWWQDWVHNRMFNAAPWLQGDEFDGVMNYRFARAVKQFAANIREKLTPQGFIDSLKKQYRDYNSANLYALMNLLDSHDTERIASMVVNPDVPYDHNAIPKPFNNWDVRKPDSLEREKQKLMVALQMTLPGAPMIYYGDETGMWGGDDPDDRKPMLWPEFKYEDESHHPFNKKRHRDKVAFDSSLFNFYRQLINLRRKEPALSIGNIEFGDFADNKNILAYKRSYKNTCMLMFANNTNLPQSIKLDSAKPQKYLEVLSGKTFETLENVKVNPYALLIFRIDR